MFINRKFKDKDDQANQIWHVYLDVGIFLHDDCVDYPLKINKMLELIRYAERELLDNVHSYSFWDPTKRPSPKDNWLAIFYHVLSKLYRRNGSVNKADEMLQRALALNDNIENL
jgi:hypothetical protein